MLDISILMFDYFQVHVFCLYLIRNYITVHLVNISDKPWYRQLSWVVAPLYLKSLSSLTRDLLFIFFFQKYCSFDVILSIQTPLVP